MNFMVCELYLKRISIFLLLSYVSEEFLPMEI